MSVPLDDGPHGYWRCTNCAYRFGDNGRERRLAWDHSRRHTIQFVEEKRDANDQ